MNKQKSSSKIFGFFSDLFASPKSKPKRVVFFVLLTMIVSGFLLGSSVKNAEAGPITDLNKLDSTGTLQAMDDWAKGGINDASNSVRDWGNDQVKKGAAALGAEALKGVIALLDLLAEFCAKLTSYAGMLLDQALTPGLYNFTNSTMITQGWATVRDVCNLFFLLILLFIAICTILKIEKYHAKKTLLMLIIMALLINFSKPIAVFIFDGSQLMMNFFLNKMAPSGNNTASMKLLYNIPTLIYTDISKSVGAKYSSDIAITYLFAIVFLFMFAVALFVTALFLFIRIVAVTLLIIVSPFAFLASAIPDFNGLASKWWSALFNYCYYGPAAAFFLYLAVKFSLSTPGNLIPTQSISGQDAVIKNILQYVVVLIFLYASILMSKQFSLAGAAAITGRADKFMKWGARMGGAGILAAGTLGQYWRAKDAAKGTLSGISQRSGMSWLTKAGREKKSKERQARAEERFAPFDIARTRKKSEERKNDAEAVIERDAHRGDTAAILQGISRGGGLADRLMADPNVQRILDRHGDLRNASYKHLRDNGQHHLQVADDVRRRSASAAGMSPAQMNEITTGMFQNSSPNAIFSDPNIHSILTTEGANGGNYLLNRLAGLEDPTMLERIRSNVKNPASLGALNNLINWQRANPAPPGGHVFTPAQAAAFRTAVLA